MAHFRMLIGGELVEASDGARMQSVDPGSGEVVATCPRASARDAEQAVLAAAQTFETDVAISTRSCASVCPAASPLRPAWTR